MRSRTELLTWGAVGLASLGFHVAAYGGLAPRPGASRRSAPKPPVLVAMEVAKPRPSGGDPSATTAVAAAATPRAPRRAVRRIAAAPPPPAAAPQAETPADFSGVTLTNAGMGAGWTSATGNGAPMNGPVGTPGARVTGRSVAGNGAQGVAAGPTVVALGELSRPPQPPDLAEALERVYPAEARRRGATGKAVVRARVTPEGGIAELAVLSETSGGFGAACKQALAGSRWTAPIGRSGQAVSTLIHYTCRFEVR